MASLRIYHACTEPLCGFSWPRHACIERHGSREAAAEHIRGRTSQCPACGSGSRELEASIVPSPWEIIIEAEKEAAHA